MYSYFFKASITFVLEAVPTNLLIRLISFPSLKKNVVGVPPSKFRVFNISFILSSLYLS